MSDDLLDVEIDASGALRALDRLGAAVDRHLMAAAKTSAEHIRDEARVRLRRQQTPNATGHTASQITARLSRDGKGYVVYVNTPPDIPANLDIWLEFGTRRGQAPRPFLLSSAQLEEGPHERRVFRALEAAIAEVQRG